MRYMVFNPQKFKKNNLILAFTFMLMKFLAAIATEFLNIFKMGQADNIDDVVKDFIAFGIIAEVDNMIIQTISKVEGMTVDDYFAENEQFIKQNDIISKTWKAKPKSFKRTFTTSK